MHESVKEVDLNLIINYCGCKLYLINPKGKAEQSKSSVSRGYAYEKNFIFFSLVEDENHSRGKANVYPLPLFFVVLEQG